MRSNFRSMVALVASVTSLMACSERVEMCSMATPLDLDGDCVQEGTESGADRFVHEVMYPIASLDSYGPGSSIVSVAITPGFQNEVGDYRFVELNSMVVEAMPVFTPEGGVQQHFIAGHFEAPMCVSVLSAHCELSDSDAFTQDWVDECLMDMDDRLADSSDEVFVGVTADGVEMTGLGLDPQADGSIVSSRDACRFHAY